jgi:hypothetical protein
MSDDTAAQDRLTAQQYRERANLIWRQAATMDGTLRRQLLVLADQYDLLADSMA